MPSIPPLPAGAALEKENREQPENDTSGQSIVDAANTNKPASSTNSATISSHSRSSSLSHVQRDPIHGVPKLSSRDSPSPQLLSRTYSNGNKRKVLRYGETLESLFCLANDTPYEHRRLCQDIADGPLADDAASWRRVLKVASNKILSNEKEASERGSDLIRLHRRATSRFSQFLDHKDKVKEDDVLALWLSYANVQASFGSMEEARLTFRHIQNQSLGVKNASFYLCLAEFEKKQDGVLRAKEALRSGLDNHAEPRQSLKDALEALETVLKTGTRDVEKEKAISPVRSAAKAAAGVPPLPTTRSPTAPSTSSSAAAAGTKRKAEESTSPKRVKKNDGTSLSVDFATASKPAADQINADDTTQGASNLTPRSRAKSHHRPVMRAASLGGLSESRSASKALEGKPKMIVKKDGSPEKSAALKSLSLTSTKSTKGRPPLLAKAPRLSSKGLSGKAQRVNPEQKHQSDSEDDSSMDTASRTETLDVSSLLENVTERPEQTKPKKVPKLDLNYMMNWDPNARRSSAPASSTSDSAKQGRPAAPNSRASMVGRTRTPTMDPIEETSTASKNGSTASAASASSVVTASLHSNTHKSDGSNESHHGSDRTAHSQATAVGEVAKSQSESQAASTAESKPTESSVSSDIAALVAKSNRDFLPLVSESNIVRVNTVPFAKLGVIGKGGSCKVYRALAKDCSIVAIKKVKLGGMDKKAINGYANEIALLKRLRGNPAIIQLYDSEVDLSRKAIFLVMELGEVDLNQVIQQQTLHGGDKHNESNRSALDMNFIRLTWQQMLKAVHCIHEERIIHGDLKPANFLFVRGALKLIDFGIAKAIQSDDTTNIYRDSQIGTLNYMSPEAILDTGSGSNGARMRIGRASDIWSLGCILYQMVYGKTPFAELHMIQKLQAIVNPSHEIHFPGGVEDSGAVDAMQLCLRRKPEERPPIIGPNGLLNEHYFLNSRRRNER